MSLRLNVYDLIVVSQSITASSTLFLVLTIFIWTNVKTTDWDVSDSQEFDGNKIIKEL